MNPGPYRRSRLVIFEPRNQPLGLLDTALRYAQLGQRGQCLAVLHRKCVVRQFDRRVQLGFGLTPVTHGDEHSAVEGAALREQERATVATREGVRGADPLHRPLEVGTQSAGHNHVAAGPHDRVGGCALSAERTRHRLVEPGHAFGKPALSDEQGPDLAGRAELQVEIPCCPGELVRLSRPGLTGHRIIAVGGLDDEQPAPHGVQLEVFDQPGEAGDPAGRGGGVADLLALVDA